MDTDDEDFGYARTGAPQGYNEDKVIQMVDAAAAIFLAHATNTHRDKTLTFTLNDSSVTGYNGVNEPGRELRDAMVLATRTSMFEKSDPQGGANLEEAFNRVVSLAEDEFGWEVQRERGFLKIIAPPFPNN